VGRRSSVGWLVALIAIVGIGLVVFVAVPLRTCPTCRGLAKKLAAPSGAVSFRVNCPECADRGTVTQSRYLRGSLLAPQVARLFQSQRDERLKDFAKYLDQVAALGGKNPDDVSGASFFPGQRWGLLRFLLWEDKNYILVEILDMTPAANQSGVGVVLLGLDGRVLDYLHCACNSNWGSLALEVLESRSPDGALLTIHAHQGNQGKETDIRDANMRASLDGSGREYPMQLGAQMDVRIGLKNGRFEVLTAPKTGSR